MDGRRLARVFVGFCLTASFAGTGPAMAGTAAPAEDLDADGVADSSDACPDTPRGVPVRVQGCAAFEIAGGLPDLLRSPAALLERAEQDIAAYPEIARVAGRLARIERMHQKALSLLREGDACKAEDLNARFLEKLTRQSQDLGRRIDTIAVRTPRTPIEPGHGDVAESDLHIADLQIAAARLRHAAAAFATDLRGLDTACDGVERPLSARGRIVDIDDANHRMTLDTGLVVRLTPKNRRKAISAGMSVDISGLEMEDATGIAIGVEPQNEVALPASLELACLHFRIAPVQAFPPAYMGALTTHNPLGYRVAGTDEKPRLMIERGQRFLVTDGGCGGGDPDANGDFTRYSAQIDVEYYAASNEVKKATVGYDLTANDLPVTLPDDIHPLAINTSMKVTVRKQTCTVSAGLVPFQCSGVEEKREENYILDIYELGELCSATYQDTAFDIEDHDPDGFRATFVSAAGPALIYNGSPLGGNPTDLLFEAEGYAWSGGVSSYPTVQKIYAGNPFAVHSAAKDFFKPAYPGSATLTGVARASGLRFPRLRGKRAGHSFWYSCSVPAITRDLLNDCGGANTDSFYRFPFEGGAPDWSLSQANFGTFTHKGSGAYAFDFVSDAGTHVLAARRGTVLTVEEGNSGNCYDEDAEECVDCDFPNGNNFVAIEHQDGTVGRYFHLPEDGAVVSEGQQVTRGKHVINVGNTGCSTGAHLHFEVREAEDEPTMEITFESAVPGFETCYLPEKGDPVESTNVEN